MRQATRLTVSVGARSYASKGCWPGFANPKPNNGSTSCTSHTSSYMSLVLMRNPMAYRLRISRQTSEQLRPRQQGPIADTHSPHRIDLPVVVFSRSRHTPGTLRSSWSTYPRNAAPSRLVPADAFAARCAVRYLLLEVLITIARSWRCSRRIRSRWLDQPPARGNWVWASCGRHRAASHAIANGPGLIEL